MKQFINIEGYIFNVDHIVYHCQEDSLTRVHLTDGTSFLTSKPIDINRLNSALNMEWVKDVSIDVTKTS